MQCRQEQRQTIHSNCRVRTGPGLPQRATVVDLSSEGCGLQSPRLALRRADKVELTFGDEHSIVAEVRWARHGEAVGLRFSTPLRPTVVDDITRQALRASIRGIAPRQQIVLEQGNLRSVC
ncbi:PilZ domain-containing protein [Croceicoccus bisphenolivorans]|uniref:PilZ domain-containing protein n=1 Tax=Croceicoccus bisphenolivorans TaxID=1783232 RepID=UPI000ACB265B|nr:PilZ domain-containing protein [Croceicoccus bisphenolivorans]